MSKEAMKLALEALECLKRDFDADQFEWGIADEAITALQEALDHIANGGKMIEQPAQQAPVPWSQALEDAWAEPDEVFPPAQQEPVAVHQFRNRYVTDWYDGVPDHQDGHGPYEVRTLYTPPPAQRTWVGLLWGNLPEDGQNHDFLRGAVWAEAKLKELNT